MFGSLVNFIRERSKLSLQIMVNCASIVHQVEKSRHLVDVKVEHWLSESKESVKSVQAIEMREQLSRRKAYEKNIGKGQVIYLWIKSFQKRHAGKIAAVLATIIAASAANATLHKAEEATGIPYEVRVEHRSVEISEQIKIALESTFHVNVSDTVHFPFDVSNQTLENTSELEDFLPNLVVALTNASHQAGYTDLHQFLQDLSSSTNAPITLQITGSASLDGSIAYNLDLSQDRANYLLSVLKGQLQGSPLDGFVRIEMVKGAGEQGQHQFDQAIAGLISNTNGIRNLINNLRNNLGRSERRALENLLPSLVKGAPQQREQAREQLAEILRDVAKLDGFLLAPYRNVVIASTFQFNVLQTKVYTKTGKMVIEVWTKTPPTFDIIKKLVSSHIFEKAILPGNLKVSFPRDSYGHGNKGLGPSNAPTYFARRSGGRSGGGASYGGYRS